MILSYNTQRSSLYKGVQREMTDELRDKIIEIALEKQKNGELKTGADLEGYIDNLLQPLMQALLEGELDNHLEYRKYEHTNKGNSRNGYCKEKTVQTKYGSMKIKTPRDRDGSFEPIVIEKGQTRMPGFEDKCISLYAKGMSLRDIEKTLKEFYGVNINKDEISHLISKVNEEVEKWRSRPLKSLYVFAYADCLYIPIKEDIRSDKKAVYVMIGVDALGFKDILGIWMDKSESATFWTEVFEDIKARGVEDILYMSSDGIAGFKGSLETVYPKTQSQRCVVHLTRNLHQICPKNEASNVIAKFKKIYQATSLEVAQIELEEFKKSFSGKTKIIEKVESFMEYLEPLYELPNEIRYAIYTSNAVESVNSALRKVTRGKGSFPSEESVFKVLFLRIEELTKKWNKPIRNWEKIQLQLIELFGDRYTKHIDF